MLNKIKRIFTLNGITNPVNSYVNAAYQLNTDPLFTTAQTDGRDFNMDIGFLSGINSSYNFGAIAGPSMSMSLTDQLSISNGAKLSFNGSGNTAFGGGPPASSNSTLYVQICNRSLTINSSSALNIGDQNLIGIVTVKSGTTLVLNPSSQLIINQGSNLIIEQGASLVFNKGASIKLLGTNSVIIVKHGGKIQIGQDAIFNYNGDGFIRFETAYPVSASIEAVGTNAQFKIVGGSFGTTNKKVLEVVGGETLADLTTGNNPPAAFSLSLFSIQNGNIALSAGSRICISGNNTKADLRSLDVRAIIPNDNTKRHRGIILNGQSGNLVYKVNMSDAITGIQSNNIYGGADVDILQYMATRCTTALNILGAGARIQDAEINNCVTAIRLEGMTRSTRLYRTNLYNNTNGVYVINSNSTVIELYQPNIVNNYYGVNAINSRLSSVCGAIKNNSSSVLTNGVYLGANVYLEDKANLILDPIMRAGAGRTDLSNTRSVSIRQSKAAYGPYIDQANSSLLTDIDYSITGTLPDRNRIMPKYPTLNANSNIWGFTNNISRSPVLLLDYKTNYNYSGVLNNVTITDVSPISQFNACGSGSTGGGGGDDRMRGWIGGQITPIRDLPDKTTPDGRTIKQAIQEGYNYFFDMAPNHQLAVSNLNVALNTVFTEEDLNDWGFAIPEINSQLIEALSEGIAEGNISKYSSDGVTYSELVQSVLNVQDKLLTDFVNDSQNLFVISMAKASIFRMLDNRDASIQVLVNINPNLFPQFNRVKESYLCMTTKEKMLIEDAISPVEFDSLYQCSNFEDFTELPPPYIEEDNDNGFVRNNSQTNQTVFESIPISVFPNPSNGTFNITFSGKEAQNYQIEVLDLLGRNVSTIEGMFLRENKLELNLLNEPSGVYFIRMTSGKDTQVRKVILTKK
jgi:hypothetical protein